MATSSWQWKTWWKDARRVRCSLLKAAIHVHHVELAACRPHHGGGPDVAPLSLSRYVPIETWIRGRVHYGWIVVAVTFLTRLGAAGIRSTPGVLMIQLEGGYVRSR